MIEKLEYQFSISNYRNVIKIVDNLLKQESNKSDYTLLMYKAVSYANLLEDEKAISIYESIIESYPTETLPKIRLALILIEIGKFDTARSQLIQARTIEPDNLEIINNQIFISEQLQEFQNVIDLSTEAIKINENEPSVWLARASARERIKEFELAIKDGLEAVSLSANDDAFLQMAYNDLGYTYSKIGDLLNAEFYLRKAIEIDDTEPYQFNNLGLVLARNGKVDKGLKLVNISISLNPNNSYAYKNRAKVYLIKGNRIDAIKDLKTAKAMDYHIVYDNEVDDLLETYR